MWTGKRRLTALVAALTLTAATGVVVRAQGNDGPPLKGEAMAGRWGFSASGTILPPTAAEPTPMVAVGVMTFDPHTRSCIVEDTLNVGGNRLFRVSDSCSYGLGEDGRGAIVVTYAEEPGVVALSFVLVDSGREMQFIRTDHGVTEGMAKRQ
jgi:hypothetical protein